MAESQSTVERIRDRVERGRALVEAGKVKRHGDLHIVAGNGGNYTVNLQAESCSCPAGRRGLACYHLAAVEWYEARERCRRAATGKPKITRHKGESLAGVTANLDRLNEVAERIGV